ncbi:MAG: sodium:proton antiporter [Nocardioides sp.]
MESVALVCLVAIGFGLTARHLERWSVGGPVVFLVAGVILGPALTDRIDLSLGGSAVQHVTELTLAILLFTDASTLGIATLRRSGSIPVRLLTIGLPLAIVAGAFLGHWLIAGISWGLAFLVASILAPTDAALSLGVMNSPLVPERIRTSLNVESGLNDGIATPFVTIFVAVVAAEESPGQGWVLHSVKEIVLAMLVAAVVGGLGAWLAVRARQAHWASDASLSLLVMALALISYAGGSTIGGNGFVASFLSGLVFALVSRDRLQDATEFSETTGVFLSYVVWTLFGALLVGPVLAHTPWDLSAIVFAVLALTVARMVPVALALWGKGLPARQVTLIGWFGPRGLASIVFLMHSLHDLHLTQDAFTEPAVEAVVWTIAISVLAHGLTSGPLIPRLTRRTTPAPAAPLGAP